MIEEHFLSPNNKEISNDGMTDEHFHCPNDDDIHNDVILYENCRSFYENVFPLRNYNLFY